MQNWNWPAIKNCAKLIQQPLLLKPTLSFSKISDIDWRKLQKDHGINAICFDKDNTITAPYGQSLHFSVIKSIQECLDVFEGRVSVFSNSIGSSQFDPLYDQADNFTRNTGLHVIKHSSKKPNGSDYILKHFDNLKPGQIALIGDRLLTDVVMANGAGFVSILLEKPLTIRGDNIPAIFLRFIEKLILKYINH